MAELSRENAVEIKFRAGSKLEECVKILIEARERGESVFGEFNGHKLYSCDVTMDSAYREVLEMTKAEFDEREKKQRAEYRERVKREEEEAKAKIPEWIERGKALIYPERLQEWEECVKYRAEDLYHGADLEAALVLMEKLESGAPMEEVIKIFEDQEHSGASAAMVRKILFIFSKRGPEFYESTAFGKLGRVESKAIAEKKRENKRLKKMHSDEREEVGESSDPHAEDKEFAMEVDIDYRYGNTLDSAIKTLEEYKARGESVYIDFNGHKLYSCDITVDGAYREVLGMTKAEFREEEAKRRREYEERTKREEEEAIAKIPSWIERGKALIYPERLKEWEECVEIRAGDLYHGIELDDALTLMEKLESGAPIEEVIKIFEEQNHSGASASIVRSIILTFSKRGPEFYKSTSERELTRDEIEKLLEITKENTQMETKDKIPTWIERGKALIYPERLQEWEECVRARAKDLYHGMELDDALAIMEELENGTPMEDVLKMFEDQNHSGASASMVRNIVLHFSKRGRDFYISTAHGEISDAEREKILEVMDENAQIDTKSKLPTWIERGRAIIYPEKFSEWKECVLARARDLYHGLDLEYALELMEMLESGAPMENVIKRFEDQNHSGLSATMVRKILLHFSKRGPDFFESTAVFGMDDKDREVVETFRRENEELKKAHKEETYEERMKREEEEAIAKIPTWIERGKALIFPERLEKWQECVEARAGDLYHGWDLEAALDIMEKLESGAPLEEVIDLYKEQGHSGASASMVRRIVFDFSRRGPEFYEAAVARELDPEDRKILEEKKRENARLAELHNPMEPATEFRHLEPGEEPGTRDVPDTRRSEEAEIVNLAARRDQLINEITALQLQLSQLKTKEEELKRKLATKQEELNKLFE